MPIIGLRKTNVPPKIFPGRLHKANQGYYRKYNSPKQCAGALDWGTANLIAYGCHSYVVVVDPVSLSVLQTLDEHRAAVCAVKWSPESLHNDLNKPYKLRLASGDLLGTVIVWHVLEASISWSLIQGTYQSSPSQIAENVRQVLDLAWHPTDASFLVVLNAPSSVTLWNVSTGAKIWRVEFSDSIGNIYFNPFEPLHLSLNSYNGKQTICIE